MLQRFSEADSDTRIEIEYGRTTDCGPQSEPSDSKRTRAQRNPKISDGIVLWQTSNTKLHEK